MSNQLKIFGKLTEIIKDDTIIINEIKDTKTLKETLFEKYPVLSEMKFFISVNNKLITENTIIENGSVVALLPPYSGG
ncbi:MoaD/ThiS family protein [Epilithonimonas sp. UC225_85]|uniref:MoaD/ThiS family protein n=1 Tax=Epilithonimonas sp. UC225_85 TaxID=3350167 RepID=UPI0036D208C0